MHPQHTRVPVSPSSPPTPIRSVITSPVANPGSVIRGPFQLLRCYEGDGWSFEISGDPGAYAVDIYHNDLYLQRLLQTAAPGQRSGHFGTAVLAARAARRWIEARR